jgi:hypothetical protein
VVDIPGVADDPAFGLLLDQEIRRALGLLA